MKNILGLISVMALLLAIVLPADTFAQANLNGTSGEKVTVSINDLTPDQLAKIEAQRKLEMANKEIETLQKKIETYGEWVGIGGEIGTAVKEGLSAVVDVADKFGKTDVGRFTMVMIAWKVVGQDVVRIILGILFFTVLTIIIVKVYRRVIISRSVLIENPGFMKYPKKYEVVKSELDSEGTVWMTIILLVVYLLGIWITYSIMF